MLGKPRDVQPGHYPLMTVQASCRMVGFLLVVVVQVHIIGRDHALTPRKTEPRPKEILQPGWIGSCSLHSDPPQLEENPQNILVTSERMCGKKHYLRRGLQKSIIDDVINAKLSL